MPRFPNWSDETRARKIAEAQERVRELQLAEIRRTEKLAAEVEQIRQYIKEKFGVEGGFIACRRGKPPTIG